MIYGYASLTVGREITLRGNAEVLAETPGTEGVTTA